MDDMIIVFFGELSTKGKNIMDFIRLLGKNIKISLHEFTALTYEIKKDHIYIHLNGVDYRLIYPYLSKIPGLISYSLARMVKNDIEEIKKLGKEAYLESEKTTFKVVTKRIEKDFPIHSDDVNRAVASKILKEVSTAKVDVHNPDCLIHIMIRKDGTYIYCKKEKGMGGYPLGIAGKSLMLLSGGIDSPVASYLMMKRGVKLEMIHFEAPPYTSAKVIEKISDLIRVLNSYQSEIKLYTVPFTDLEKKIYEVCGPSYLVTIMRRMMLRIAERVAYKHNCLAIATGESIGQVASQTLYSMKCIEKVSSLPVFRPLCTYDKTDIISLAKQIGTYDISIRPYEDCCTIFDIKDPVTHPHDDIVEELEKSFDYESMIKDCLYNIKTTKFSLIEEEL